MSEELVNARYLGDVQVVFPHLAGLERKAVAEAHAAWAAGGGEGLNPRCVVNPGDVIAVDAASVQGREDLELVETAKPKAARKPKED